MDEMIVVSDIGEQWSPNTPPPMVAATTRNRFAPCNSTMGIAMEIMMAKVPHDVPVEKAIKEERIKITAGNKAGESHSSVIPATYSPVPRVLHT